MKKTRGRGRRPQVVFARFLGRGDPGPRVVVVAGRQDLDRNYDLSIGEIIDASYGGGGWEKFESKLAGALSLPPKTSTLVAVEVVAERAAQRPLIIYVGGAARLAGDCGADLVKMMALWDTCA